jgi:hypothetical protein
VIRGVVIRGDVVRGDVIRGDATKGDVKLPTLTASLIRRSQDDSQACGHRRMACWYSTMALDGYQRLTARAARLGAGQ